MKIHSRYIKAAWPFRGKSSDRIDLLGVHAHPHAEGGALIMASNGHIAVCIHDQRAQIASPARISKYGTPAPHQGQFPYEKLMSLFQAEGLDGPKDCLDPRYLKKVAKSVAALSTGSPFPCLAMRSTRANGPVKVTARGVPAIWLIMPTRDDQVRSGGFDVDFINSAILKEPESKIDLAIEAYRKRARAEV